METDKLIEALRCCGNRDYKKPDCDHCPLLNTRMCVKVMLESAAVALEEKDAEIATLRARLAAAVKTEHRMAEFIILHGLADTYLCDDVRTDFKTVYCTENPHDDSCTRCIIQHFGRGLQETGEVEQC